ncbi:hypothetical protein FIBSPDRAFT_757398, partial [Athelia psychrophila]
LWYDVTNGYGHKWKRIFHDLEIHHGLDPSCPPHIWLLHCLFLRHIDRDAQEWMETWNHHKLRLPGGSQQSLHQMFTFSMVTHRPRGVQHMVRAAPIDEEVDDPDSYVVDWEVHDDDENTPHDAHDAADTHPFATSATPYQLSDVPCLPPNCPLTPAQVLLLDGELTGSTMFGNPLSDSLVSQSGVTL